MDKFKALVHLVIQDCEDPKRLGAVRLNKILWWADKEAYRMTGASISGSKYVRRMRGPVPSHVLRSLRELEEEGNISIRHPTEVYEPRLFKSEKPASNEMFSEFEKRLVNSYAKIICTHFTADEISELSHDDIWEAANEGEEIPLSATLVSEAGDFRAEVTNWADTVIATSQA